VNNQKTLVKIISKLPPYLQHVALHVVTFVKAAAEEINDPVYGKVLETGKPRVGNDGDRY